MMDGERSGGDIQEAERPTGPNRVRDPEGVAHPLDRNRGTPTPAPQGTPSGRTEGRDVTPDEPQERGDRDLDSPWMGGG